jgi:hypothetical protein
VLTVRDNSYSKGKERRILEKITSKINWTQYRTPTTNMLLKIRVAHGLPP